MTAMDLDTGTFNFIETSRENCLQMERDKEINLEVDKIRHRFGNERFTKEAISILTQELSAPSTSHSIIHEVWDRYMKSFGRAEYDRFLNEIIFFREYGEVSSFFVRGQQLDDQAAEELSSIVRDWVANTTKERFQNANEKRENAVSGLLIKFDIFKEKYGVRDWTYENLKLVRSFLLGSSPPGQRRDGKRKMDLDSGKEVV
jgi:hypothetical protein